MSSVGDRYDVVLLTQFGSDLQPELGPCPEGEKITGFLDPGSGHRYEPEIAWRRYSGLNDSGELLTESAARAAGLVPMAHLRSAAGFSLLLKTGTRHAAAELLLGVMVLIRQCLRLRWTERFRLPDAAGDGR